MPKKAYRVKNWPEYNKALVSRGSLTVWFDEPSVQRWHAFEKTGKRGHPCIYSATAIETALTLRAIFKLPLRATEGLIASLINLLNLPIKAPNYTTICRRQKGFEVPNYQVKTSEPIDVVIDSSGVKVYGEGEWKVKQHGKNKRRTWRKIHIAVDPKTGDVVATKVTKANKHDASVLPDLLKGIETPIHRLCLDGMYDTGAVYEAIAKQQAIPLIPPRKTGVLSAKRTPGWQWRNWAITQVKATSYKAWKQQTGYHKRSLAETTFFRLKQLFGACASNRRFDHQVTELVLRCQLLNRFNQLGLPQTVPV